MSAATTRGNWGSRAGFVLAAAGSAVGLGNIWEFPTRVAQAGGAA
jgi:NSS family neurotransmitter:Na+ symporter